MGIVDNAKDIAKLVRDVGNMELYQKIIDLQAEIVELSNEKYSVDKELSELKRSIDLEKSMVYKKPFYMRDGDDQPFCPICWETKNIATHLEGAKYSQYAGKYYFCKHCTNKFYIKEN